MRNILSAAVVLFVLGSASAALAHPHHGLPHSHLADGGLSAGLLHPLLGVDHLLAMLAVGVVAAWFTSHARWFVPAGFVGGMLLGGVSAMAGLQVGLVEAGIALSLIVLGCGIAAGRKLPLLAVVLVMAAFGGMHGSAHGQEVPSLASPLLYTLGFVVATIALHLVGVGVGALAQRNTTGVRSLQASGAALAAFGVFLLVAGV